MNHIVDAAEMVLTRAIRWLILLATAAALSCTRVSYDPETGAVSAISVMQKRSLVVEAEGVKVYYTSGSDPIVIQTPYGALGGVQ